MPAKNIYHDAVVNALRRDGWTILADPFSIAFGGRDLFVDIGAERPTIAVQRGVERAAVEVHSFASPSPVNDLERAVGQYVIYRLILQMSVPAIPLFLAITATIHESFFAEPLAQLVVKRLRMNLLVIDPAQEKVVQWIKSSDTATSSGD